MTINDVLLTVVAAIFAYLWCDILIMAGSTPDRVNGDFVSRGPIERAIWRIVTEAVRRAVRKTDKDGDRDE